MKPNKVITNIAPRVKAILYAFEYLSSQNLLLVYLPFDMDKAIDLRSKCGHFRILIMGRANAGKTTILKKVCNSIDEPEIFSPSNEKVIKSPFEPSSLLNGIVHDLLQLDPTIVQESSEVRLAISLEFTFA